MLVDQVFSAHLVLPDSSYQDITDGIINVDISHGTEVYEGPYQQIDTGLFTIVSRSSNLDPNVNADVTEGAAIEFRDSRNVEAGKSNVFFLGYITDIDVQYQRDDDPIITITGTDVFGLLQRTVVSEGLRLAGLSFVSGVDPNDPDYNGPSLKYLVNHPGWQFNTPVEINVIETAGTPGGIDPALPYDNYLNYAPARYLPELGETLLEILNKYTQTNLNYCSVNYRETPGIIDVYPYAKYNSFFWPPVSDPALEFPTYNFSSDPADGRPYETILLNNGYNRRTKALDISNETRFADGVYPNSTIESTTIKYPPYKNNEDVTQVATSLNTNFSTSFVNEDSIELYATDIFQAVNLGGDEIQQITFDNGRKEDIDNDYTYSFSQLNQFIRIKHQVSQNYTIDRFYDIAGVRHNITPDKWEMGFTFKPSQNELAFAYQGQVPTIQMNALTGDSNFNFTATITNYPTEDIDQVFWCLNGTNSNVNEQWIYTVGGERYKDFTPRTGLTQTWNFDDDGILAEVPTGGYGTGEWYVIPYIILKNGWVMATNVKLTVGTPEVDADFFWSQNLTNNFGQVTFTDDSHNNEIGEPDSYLWNFGDGTTSTLQNPVKIYDPAPGQTTYNVSLTVFAYGVGGAKVYNTRTKTVTLTQPTMTANFTSSASGSTVTFTNTSTNVGFEEPDAYLWDFGDGTTSTLKNPVKLYAGAATVPLTFSVTLTTRNIWEQTATVTKNVTIAALYNTGTLPVTQVRISKADAGSNSNLMMSYLQCLRSDGANLSLNTTTTRANDPGEVWWQYPGATGQYDAPPLTGTGLTRNILLYPNEGGLQFRGGGTANNPSYSLNTTIPSTQQISNIKMRFDDIFPAETSTNKWWDRNYVLANDSFGGFFPIGYWDLPAIPNFTPRQNFGREYTMTPIRPMPLNIPYFKYTFNNTTVSFTSVETADSYAWTFGDGTTSTLKDPVKTYASKGTYTVTLAVTNGGVVTRTTTEPVIVEALNPFSVRYVKLVQNNHTGTHAFDTPYVARLWTVFNRNQTVQTNPTPYPVTGDPVIRTVAKAETYSQEYWSTTGLSGNPFNQINPLVSPDNSILSWDGGGVRAKSLDATFRTGWELIQDFQTPIDNILQFQLDLARYTVVGFPSTAATGISYSIYVTDYVGAPAGIGSATWTHVANLTPTAIVTSGQPKRYTFAPI